MSVINSLSWKVTENCNSRCNCCVYWRKQTEDELSTEECKRLIREASEVGVQFIRFTGGEPTLRTDLQALIDYCNQLRIRVSLQTNGLNPLTYEGVSEYIVSLDGVGEDYERVRGLDASDRVIQHVLELRKRSPVSIIIAMILMRGTVSSLPAIVELAEKEDLRITFNLINTPTEYDVAGVREFNDGQTFMFSEWQTVIGDIRKVYNTRLFYQSLKAIEHIPFLYTSMEKQMKCQTVLRNYKVGSRGQVYPGCWSAEPVGCVRERGLREIVNSHEYRERVMALHNLDCGGCTCGWYSRVKQYLGI